MMRFVQNAIKHGELKKMEPEIFWSLAYGPFYSLLKFHLQGKSMMTENYSVNDTKMKQLLKMVVKALTP